MKKAMILVLFLLFFAGFAGAAERGVAVKGTATATAVENERKTALVIGNSTYISSPLKNPASDAKTVAKALRDLGFTVDERTNLNQNDMKLAIESFGKAIKQGGVGLFFYAGHGMQVNGRNYLIPVDVEIQGEAEVDIKAVDAGAVLAKMDIAKNSTNIVILDACRNNPFARSFRSANSGLASMNAPSGTLIAYATAPGSVASDGTGANGLYTQEVVKAIKKPGLKIEDAFKQVRSGVQNQTQGKQVPWESSSLVGDFYFAGKPEGWVDTSRLEGLAEGSKERQAELERLKKLEAENAKQKEKEQAEITKREKELAALDAQIASMKSRLGTAAESKSDSLEKMAAIVEKKEEEGRKLDELRRQRKVEEAKRQAEINRLKEVAAINRRAEIEKDVVNYEKIVSSSYGKDMTQQAWQALRNKYPETKGIVFANTNEFRKFLIGGIIPEGELSRRRDEAEKKRKTDIEKDIVDYETTIGTSHESKKASKAWQALMNKYPEAKGIAFANTNELRKFIFDRIIPEGEMVKRNAETEKKRKSAEDEMAKRNAEAERKRQNAMIESFEFVLVKGGCFQMGDTFGEGYGDEKPVHEVCIDDYYMGKYEVTQEQWRQVMGHKPSKYSSCGGNCPVEQVSWNDVKEFIRILNIRAEKNVFRLPTEAEWEYAARSGGKNEKWAGTSNESQLGDYAWFDKNSGNQTHPVGRKRPNGLGIYDMSGNVFEWVADIYSMSAYSAHSRNNPMYTGNDTFHVVRGGSVDSKSKDLRVDNRGSLDHSYTDDQSGFRLARTK